MVSRCRFGVVCDTYEDLMQVITSLGASKSKVDKQLCLALKV